MSQPIIWGPLKRSNVYVADAYGQRVAVRRDGKIWFVYMNDKMIGPCSDKRGAMRSAEEFAQREQQRK
jgi:hypothetical protein